MMESNQELMLLSLLNLYASYKNLRKKSVYQDKTQIQEQARPRRTIFKQNERIAGRSVSKRTTDPQSSNTNFSRAMDKDELIDDHSVSKRTTDIQSSNTIASVAMDKDESIDNSSVRKRTTDPQSSNTISSCAMENDEHIFYDSNVVPNENSVIGLKTKRTINDKTESTANYIEENNLTKVKPCVTRKRNRAKEGDPNRKRRVRRWRVRPINMDRVKAGYHRKVFSNVKKMDQEQFFEHTRMSKRLFDWLLSFVHSAIRTSRQMIFPEERLVMTLNYLAYGTPLQSIAWKHKVGKSTVRQIVLDTCSVLWNSLSPIYLSEPTTPQYADIAEDFKTKYNIPNCVGAIDAKNVSIRVPRRKDASNLIIFGACDTKYKFSAISIRNFEKLSNEGVFQLSSCNNVVLSDRLPLPSNKPLVPSSPPFPHFFVANTSFPLQKNVMRPYTETNLDVIKTVFNYKISCARAITENTFGLLTARFRVLLTTLEFLPESCEKIILACIALHNYIISNDEQQLYCPENFVDREMESGIVEEGEWRRELQNNGDQALSSIISNHYRSTNEANNLRDILANFFATSEEISYEIEIV